MIDKILQLDKELFLFLNGLGTETWDSLWLAVTNKWIFGSLYAIILIYLIFKKLGVKYVLFFIVITSLLILFTDQITNLFKYVLVKRPRPCQEPDIQEVFRFVAGSCGRYGFFSGHSSNSMAIAVFIGLSLRSQYKNLIFFFLFFSAVIAYSRIYVGVHYPLDIIFGMLFGAIAGYLFYKLQAILAKKFISS